jgi:hypothetical protein
MFGLIVNSLFISEAKLEQIEAGKLKIYLVNFLVGCEGILGDIGTMSYTKVFVDGEWWRLILHMYLHAGIWHVLFNILALLYVQCTKHSKIALSVRSDVSKTNSRSIIFCNAEETSSPSKLSRDSPVDFKFSCIAFFSSKTSLNGASFKTSSPLFSVVFTSAILIPLSSVM